MWWLIIIFFLLLFSYFLFAPFILEINSDKGIFSLRSHYIASADLALYRDAFFLNVKIAWWRKQFNLLEPNIKDPETSPAKKHRQKSSKKIPFKKILNLIKSFRVRKFLISLDTDNMQWNGIMYPIFLLAEHYSGRQIEINFTGENIVIMKIENNIARILWAYIKK